MTNDIAKKKMRKPYLNRLNAKIGAKSANSSRKSDAVEHMGTEWQFV
jgi:hypothetical protein